MPWLKKLHKWVGLLIGVQVLLWLVSGLAISLLDPAKVSGRQWARDNTHEPQPFPPGVYLEPAELAPELQRGATGITLEIIRGQPVYRVKNSHRETLVHAVTGMVITTSRAGAEEIARTDYAGNGVVASVSKGAAPDPETRNSSGDYWKVVFSDRVNTTLYISAASGEVLARRNSYWRVRDFFWMLHNMDYAEREDFNHPLIISVALIAIWLGISGIMLLFGSFSRRDFYFLNIAGKRNFAVVTLVDSDADAPVELRLRKGANLFRSLASHGIDLPSRCGGGGECGLCRVNIEADKLSAANPVESVLLPRARRQRGDRLACQHMVLHDATLYLPRGTLAAGD
jgi:ferredoxin/uncharacterized iron-regulated membrane protein